MRILHDKNDQNWSSGLGEICLVRFLLSDRHSVRGPGTLLVDLKFFAILCLATELLTDLKGS